MREPEFKAAKEPQEEIQSEKEQETKEEDRLMEEKKKKKQEEKKKKEAAQKKAAEHKTKVPETTKTSQSQPQPANSSNSTSTTTITNSSGSNGKRASTSCQQQALSRYPPREVPPRFRHQEQKQLLKRGQPLPPGTAISNSLAQGTGQVAANSSQHSIQQTSGGPQQLQHLGKGQTDLSHSGLGTHYENSHWGQPPFRSEPNSIWDKVIIDGSDKEAWPSICGNETETASECTDTDSASNCGSDTSSMATGSAPGNFNGQNKNCNNSGNGALVQSSSNQSAIGGGANGGNGNSSRVWAVASGSAPGIGHCSATSGSGKMDSIVSVNPNCWGTSTSSAGINLNLNPNANPAAWPVVGQEIQGTVGGGNASTVCSSSNSIDQSLGNPNNGPTGTLNTWGNLLQQESTEIQTSTSQNVSFSIQPQNLNTDGPNNTNPINSSPNPINAMQANGLPNVSVPGGWAMTVSMGAINPSHLQNLPGGSASPAVSQLNGGNNEGMNNPSCNSVWGVPHTNPTATNGNSGFSQGNGDTVNSALSLSAKQTLANSSNIAVEKDVGNNAWDSGPPTSPGVLPWTRAGNIGGLHSGPSNSGAWGNTSSNRNTNNGVNGEWGKPSNQHSSNEANGNGKGSCTWEGLCVNSQTPVLQQSNEQINSWAKPSESCTTGSEGSNESGTSHHEGSTGRNGGRHNGSRRKTDKGTIEQQGLVQSVVLKSDHDPRVLCNTGWGQTPVKQNISWEIQESPRSERKSDNGTEAWGSAAAQSSNSGGRSDGSSMNSSNTSTVSGWGNHPPTLISNNTGWGDKVSNGQGGWGDSANSNAAATAKSGHAWSGVPSQEEKPSAWVDSQKSKMQNWGEGQKTNQGWASGGGSGGGDWTDSATGPLAEGKKNGSSWDSENNRSAPNWNETTRPQNSGWSNGTTSKPNPSTGWGEPLKSNVPQNWGNKPQDNNVSTWGGAASVKQSNSGWVGGPLSAKQKDNEPTGWEEPSPPSIRRKIEIDDGTSAWGDPTNYKKAVNMWDRNNPVNQSSNNTVTEQQPPPPHQSSAAQNRSPLLAPGWGETLSVPTKTENSWGEPPSPSTSVDNGTSAWGKPPNGSSGWGDNTVESTGNFGRGSVPATAPAMCKPASKTMQEGWVSSGDEVALNSNHHSNWEEDEGEMGMWNNVASQESNSSCNSSGWTNASKKVHQKGIKASSKQEETWLMNRLIKQLTDMGFPREPAEEALKCNNLNLDQAMGALLEKKVEMDKRGMGMSDYNGIVSKPLGCRPPSISKESSVDRPTYFDKLTLSFSNQDGGLMEESPTSPFLPSPSLKLALSNSAHPNQALGAIASGLGMQNLNSSRQSGNLGMFGNSGAAQARTMQQQQQPPVQPLNSSQPSLRAQVPQFLSPQVQAQLLQFAAKNMGLNPALLASPINPQHMTMLNQLYQLQLAYQRLLFQQQMLQAQRNVSGTIRQQEQQVARTINNMQQQIQQHQRQLTQALLMKQQQPHPPLHPSAGKVTIDNLSHHPPPSLSDLQTKEQQTSPNSFPAYSLAGLIPNMNVSNMELNAGISMKDPAQAQSRLRQWTHPNSIENLSSNSLSLEQNQTKHGAIPGGLNIGPTSKPSLEDSYSPYDLITSSESPASPPVPVSDSWTRAKSPADKISNGSNINWPPEFRPGEPWKGLQNIDPETDPNVTPGSVPSGPSINTTIRDVDRYLLRDRSGGSSPTSQNATLPSSSAWSFSASGYTSSFSSSTSAPNPAAKLTDKSTWSPGPIAQTQAPLSHELWKVPLGSKNTRPPPGLTNTKPSPSWGVSSLGLVSSWPSSYSSSSAWSTDSNGRNNSWLVLRNLTPQIDGSTLRTLCMQHGPLITFHLNLTQGNAVVRYSSKEEAAKAQKSLHMCVLGNTTILAEFASDEEVNRFFAQGQSLSQTSSWQSNAGTNQSRLGSSTNSHGLVRNDLGHWNTTSLSGKGTNDLLWSSVPQYSSSLWGPPNNDDTRVIGSPTPINTLLPGDLLSGESM
ncbi:trinucleotide repeat-containing gene 6C protein isoform X1 [Hypanus sabinus]|uniref:trinucleotide repeat-containing gene 6C protein isoform X1 n=2 Tax=Hypanus sabinus TaxID=79690 RepID=UPI0028C4D692|nr:trinucleotide repeat-containing gene 6C protein isoform X1 [Hypanus sabinus]